MNHPDEALVYLAGPYTQPDPVRNTHRMMKIADALLKLHVVPFVPHLTMLWHLAHPRSQEFWVEYDLHLLKRCDVVLRVPGESKGADAEVSVARELRIPVLHPAGGRVQDCVEAVSQWLLGRTSQDEGTSNDDADSGTRGGYHLAWLRRGRVPECAGS